MLIMAKYLGVTPTSPIPNFIIYNALWKFHLPSCKMITIRTSPQEPLSKQPPNNTNPIRPINDLTQPIGYAINLEVG
jgi:hypothetical protein